MLFQHWVMHERDFVPLDDILRKLDAKQEMNKQRQNLSRDTCYLATIYSYVHENFCPTSFLSQNGRHYGGLLLDQSAYFGTNIRGPPFCDVTDLINRSEMMLAEALALGEILLRGYEKKYLCVLNTLNHRKPIPKKVQRVSRN